MSLWFCDVILIFNFCLKAGGGGGGGELGVNKKGTPLYSREDIREQYCINDKELQVLDRSQRKSLLGCFSNQGQVSSNPQGGLPLPLLLEGSFIKCPIRSRLLDCECDIAL